MNDCKTRSGRAFDRQAWTYDTARFGSHARGLYPVLLEQLVQIPHGSVLDVGCGTGELLREVGLRFPETARTGLDLSANMLAVAREKLGGAAALMLKNRNVGETLHDPKKMAISCGIIGMIVVAFLNLTASSVPEALQVTAVKVLVPAANLLVNTVMPVIFWLAAIDAGKKSGFWATIFGGAAQLIMGNAVPGLVLGILIGKGVEESGWNRVTKVMMVAIVALFVLSGFFRGFDMKMIESFHLTVPNWLDMIHNSLSGK